MTRPLTLLLSTLTLLPALPAQANWQVTSPDGRLTATIDKAGAGLTMALRDGTTTLIEPSPIGLEASLGPLKPGKPTTRSNVREHIAAPFYRQAEIDYTYNELTLPVGKWLSLTVRVSDEGAAYRWATHSPDSLTVAAETLRLQLPGENLVHLAYSTNERDPWAMAFQNRYTEAPIGELPERPAFLPLCIDYAGGTRLSVMESDLKSYPGLWLQPDNGSRQLRALFAPYPAKMARHPWRYMTYVSERAGHIARIAGSRTLPWRILAVSRSDTHMPVNNLVYALAEPSNIKDTSWIEPGKSAWEWWNDWGLTGVDFRAGIDMQTYKYYIDFAGSHGLPYVVLDEGWYEPADGDMLHSVAALELPELVEYARERGVRLILWTVFNVLDEQLEAACARYERMGIAGFKVDFLDRDDQTAVEMTWRIAEACARHHLILDYHGLYKPVGLNRTWPNVLNVEAVFGMEEVKWSEPGTDMPHYDATFPYLRGAAGPVDYTPGALRNASREDWRAVYKNPVSMGTRAHQVAAYVVHDAPLAMLADAPTAYMREKETTAFICHLPTVCDETRCLAGSLGEYIVMARRKGDRWYVAGQTNWTGRDVTVDCSFLAPGADYLVNMFTDGANADENAEDYDIRAKTVQSSSQLTVHMASGGGFCLSFQKK